MNIQNPKICHQCQSVNPADARFCDSCGKSFIEAAPQPPTQGQGVSRQIITVDASKGGVVAVGSGAKAIQVGQGGTYIENQSTPSPATATQRCPQCQQSRVANDRFCPHCGSAL